MKYPKTLHLPFSQCVNKDDRVADDISNIIGKEIVITEKLDGSNVFLGDDIIHGRSDKSKLGEWNHNFYWDKRINVLQINLGVRKLLGAGNGFFFENLNAVHSIEYPQLNDYIHLINITTDDGWFTKWFFVEEQADIYGFPTVPKLFEGVCWTEQQLKGTIGKLMSEDSVYGGKKEGVVVRTTDAFPKEDFDKNVFKFVRENHNQTDSNWKREWKKAELIQSE